MVGMRFRKLRIAWSAGWSVAAILLIVLWVRSYTWGDSLTVPVSKSTVFRFSSGKGVLLMHLDERPKTLDSWRLTHISMVMIDEMNARFVRRGGPASVINNVNRWTLRATLI